MASGRITSLSGVLIGKMIPKHIAATDNTTTTAAEDATTDTANDEYSKSLCYYD